MEPVTTVCLEELLNEPDRPSAARLLDHPNSRGFRERLLACVGLPELDMLSTQLLDKVTTSRPAFYRRLRQQRLGLSILEVLQNHLRATHLKISETRYGFMSLARSTLDGEIKHISKIMCSVMP
jgi:origin recognition complex subunit 3